MPVVIPAGFGEVTFVFTGGPSDPMTNVLGVDPPDGMPTPDIAQLAAEAYSAAAATNPQTFQWFGVTFDRTIARRNLAGVMQTAEFPVGTVGEVGGQPMPFNTSVLVRKTTAIGGRRGRGRWYFMGANELDSSDGAFLDTGPRNAYQGAFTNMFNDLVADLLNPVVLHDTAAVAPTPITGFSVQARLATQRRRLR